MKTLQWLDTITAQHRLGLEESEGNLHRVMNGELPSTSTFSITASPALWDGSWPHSWKRLVCIQGRSKTAEFSFNLDKSSKVVFDFWQTYTTTY